MKITLHAFIGIFQIVLCYSASVPLIIFGVDGYGYELYKEYGNKSSDDTNIFPIKTVFPSKTFPNFFSIATGLHPTQHGIISNKFMNKKMKQYFTYENEQADSFDWYKAEPIWITAKKAGLRVYADMWVGSAAQYNGIRPDIYSVYNGKKTIEEKVEDLVRNLDNSSEKCDFYIFYTNQPDLSLHKSDITNRTTAQIIITEAERQISLLKSSLGTRIYNLVVVSDHGMASYKHKYNMDEIMSSRARKLYGGAIGLWYTQDCDAVETMVEDLNEYLEDSNMTGIVAKQVSTLPKRFELCGLEREGNPEIVLMMDNEVALGVYSQKSGHGYDNTFPDMFGHVRVVGPGFKKIPYIEQFNNTMNTELYNMFCSLLDIQPTSNTGKLDTFDFMLDTLPNRTGWQEEYLQLPTPCSTARHNYISIVLIGLIAALTNF